MAERVIHYPEPFSADVPVHPAALVATVENAHVEAASPYGDEGDGYDMHLMVQVLLDQGWTPPADLPDHAEQEQP